MWWGSEDGDGVRKERSDWLSASILYSCMYVAVVL